MVSPSLTQKFIRLYRKAAQNFKTVQLRQERLLSIISSIAANAVQLKGLLKEQNFGILRKHAGLQDKLIAKQMSRLESMIGKAHTTLQELQACHQASERQSREGMQLLQSGGSMPSAQSCASRLGSLPSAADVIEGLQDLRNLLGDMIALDIEIVGRLNYDADAGAVTKLLPDMQRILGVTSARAQVLLGRVLDCGED